MKEYRLETPFGDATTSTLSPDGSEVAFLIYPSKPSSGGNASNNGYSTIEVWNVASSKAIANLALPIEAVRLNPVFADPYRASLHYCNHGKNLIAYDTAAMLHVFGTDRYSELFALDLVGQGQWGDSSKDDSQTIILSACAANSNLVIVEETGGRHGAGVLKVFNLDTEAQTMQLDHLTKDSQVAQIAISPQAQRAAILQREADGVTVVDLNTGTSRVHLPASAATSEIAFVGESMIAIASNPTSPVNQPSIGLWDLDTGLLVRQFGEYPGGANGVVEASADGRILLGRTLNELRSGLLGIHVGDWKIASAQFILWQVDSGKRIGLSPELHVVRHECHWYTFSLGACTPTVSLPSLELSQSGKAVLVHEPNGPMKVDFLQ